MSPVAVRLVVTGMHCASCGILIDEVLEDLPGVQQSSTSVRKGTCEVRFDDQHARLDQITQEIASLGYTAAQPVS